jgi:SagB-type dehydrogenase family enzyme
MPSGRATHDLYRRSPFVVAYWEDGRPVLHQFARGRRAAVDPVAFRLLDAFPRWRTLQTAARLLPDAGPAAIARAARWLAREGFLDRRSPGERPRASAHDVWASWNPAAGFFHFSTRDAPFVDVETARRHARAKARREPPPPFVKTVPGAPRVALPRPAAEGDLPAALLARRTWRRFGGAPLELEDAALLLHLSFGIQGWMDLGAEGRAPRTTSPSGGARHPLEAYALVRRVRGLRAGLYHYDARGHALERLPARAAAVRTYLPTQWWFDGAALVVFLTAVFARPQWRYESPRAYRAVLLEAGHAAQTFCLVATWRGLAPFTSMALADTAVERALGVDGVGESALYAMGVGPRPPRADAPGRPGRRRPPRRRPSST